MQLKISRAMRSTQSSKEIAISAETPSSSYEINNILTFIQIVFVKNEANTTLCIPLQANYNCQKNVSIKYIKFQWVFYLFKELQSQNNKK